MDFKIKDKVQWTSQSHGTEKTKVGVIVAVVMADTALRHLPLPDGMCLPRGTVMVASQSRNHVSYLVQVGRQKHLYWPRVTNLRRVA